MFTLEGFHCILRDANAIYIIPHYYFSIWEKKVTLLDLFVLILLDTKRYTVLTTCDSTSEYSVLLEDSHYNTYIL